MMATEQDDAGAGDILVGGRVQECPFCDEYNGTSVGRHVAHKPSRRVGGVRRETRMGQVVVRDRLLRGGERR